MTLINLVNLAYLLSAVLFIVGLKRLSSPATARSGNMMGATGMLIAVLVTLIDREALDYAQIAAGMVIGAGAGAVLARTIKMTAMPQMVAIFNGLGGGASALVASGEFHKLTSDAADVGADVGVTIMLGTFIGAVTLSGSFIAFGKLQDIVSGRAISSPVIKALNPILFLTALGLGGYLVVLLLERLGASMAEVMPLFLGLVVVSLALGSPAGHADRRSGHAGGDSAAELVLRTGCRSRRFRAGQHGAHHQRLAGGRVRVHPDSHHVHRDEPLDLERDVRRVRRAGRGSRPGGERRAARRSRPRRRTRR